MSDESNATEPQVDFSAMTLDGLRRLAEQGPDAAGRARARREIEVRSADAGQSTVECSVHVGTSGYGTPEPRLMVVLSGGARGRRWVQAALYDRAAEIERTLAASPEGWVVGPRVISEGSGFIFVSLMTGSPAEVQRAVAVLERLAGATLQTGKGVGRQPGKRRTAIAVTVTPDGNGAGHAVAPEPALGVPAKPDSSRDESEGRARRRKKQRYRELAGDAAEEFEARQLESDPAGWPACVRSVLAGGPKAGEYWVWLIDRWVMQHSQAEVAS